MREASRWMAMGAVCLAMLVAATAAIAQAPSSSPPPASSPPASTPPAEASATAGAAPAAEEASAPPVNVRRATIALAVGIVTVLGLIIVAKTNAFIALITAAILVSLIAPGEMATKVTRVATAFGTSAGNIGIVIALAAVIGKCMLDSGAADRIVRAFLRLFGERQSPTALMGSGFVLAVPVFFDTVFYLLVPLARSLHRKTGREFLRYVLAISAGGAITHTLVPPTPGPLTMASNLGFDYGLMIMVGLVVALPAAIVGLLTGGIMDRLMPTPMRQIGNQPDPEPLADHELPPLWLSLLPVVLPVVLISGNTIVKAAYEAAKATYEAATAEAERAVAEGATAAAVEEIPQALTTAYDVMGVLGNANLALLISTVIALATVYFQRQLSLRGLGHVVETSLMSGGVIILITAAGGAFGAMLTAAEIGEAIKQGFAGHATAGIGLLALGFSVAALLKVAQGSSTVAMITASSMLASLLSSDVGYHPVYLACAIGGGSLVGSWMNDSGFWIFAKMSGLTEIEALKSWSILLVVMALVSFGTTIVLASVWPYPLGMR